MRRLVISLLAVLGLVLVASFAAVVAEAGGGCHGTTSTPPGDDAATVVKIDGCMFYPTVARVHEGATVTFINTGDVPHNVTGVGATWGSGQLANGAHYTHAFPDAGVYPFACTWHPGMNGAVVVGEASTGAQVAPAGAPAVVVADAGGPQAVANDGESAAVGSPATQGEPASIPIGTIAGLAGGVILGALGTWIAIDRRRSRTATTD